MNKTVEILLEGKHVDLENMEIVNKKVKYSFLGILIPMCLLIVSMNNHSALQRRKVNLIDVNNVWTKQNV